MSVEHLEVDSKTSESDIYAALMLSKMLDSEQDEVSTSSPNNITDQSSEILDTQNVIWYFLKEIEKKKHQWSLTFFL